jgi:hypothetical protein
MDNTSVKMRIPANQAKTEEPKQKCLRLLGPNSRRRAGPVWFGIGRHLAQLGPFLEAAQKRLMRQTEFRRGTTDPTVFALEGFGDQLILLLFEHSELTVGWRNNHCAGFAH